ncbi:MAG: manganese-dependent inorganic pyrophosphatase, partial [Desulfobulbaceae bacterium]|nr:manganese-dependent inorganic pyrophosphatase [Desulfobulbaceae bacterium]
LYKALQEVKDEGGRHSIFLMLTDIMKEGTDLMAITDDPSIIEKAFGKKLEGQTVWIDGMMSRKKQTIPPLQKVFGA